MAQRVRDILLRIRGDASDAEAELHDLAREVKAFGQIDAEATLDVNTQAAQRQLAAAENAVKSFGRLTAEAKIDLQTRAAQVKLDGLNRNLANLQRKPTTPKVELAIGSTIAKIERVEHALDKLERRRVDVNVDVDRSGGPGRVLGGVAGLAGAVAGGIGAAVTGITEVTAAATRGIPIIGNFAAAFAQLGASGLALGPVLLILVPIIGVALAGAVALLTGAVVALGASFLAAAAGVGVLGVALAGAFGPVLLVAIAAMARFAKILEAVKAQEEGAATAATDHADALRQQATAAEAVDDAVRGIADAELSRDQARLNVKQAEQALADFRKEAGLTKTSLDDLFTKFTNVDYRPENLIGEIGKSALGEEGVDPLQLQQLILNVRSARQGEQAAIDGVSDAHDRLAEARQTEADALTEQNEKLDDLTGKEQRLVDVLVALKQTLTDVFRPATQRIFAGVIAFLEDLSAFAKDSRVRGGLTAIGAAIEDMLRRFGRVLRSRETREAFGELARGGARLLRQLTPVFTGLFRLVTRVAQIALPWLIDVVGDVGRAIRKWAGDTDRSDIERFVRRVRRSFTIWMGIVKELFLIVKEFFGEAKDSGDDLAETIQKILRRFRRWLEENPDAIKRFFEQSKDFATGILDAIPGIIDGFKEIAGLAGDIRDIVNTMQWPSRKVAELAFGPGDEANAPVPQKTIEANIRFAQQGQKWAIENLIAWGFDRQHLRRLGVRGFALGGLIPGLGRGDRVPILAEPGEFMLRRSVAQAIGAPRLNLLNAGRFDLAGMGAAGGGIHIDAINLPPAPGHSQLGDPRHQAVQLARELRRRGNGGII